MTPRGYPERVTKLSGGSSLSFRGVPNDEGPGQGTGAKFQVQFRLSDSGGSEGEGHDWALGMEEGLWDGIGDGMAWAWAGAPVAKRGHPFGGGAFWTSG